MEAAHMHTTVLSQCSPSRNLKDKPCRLRWSAAPSSSNYCNHHAKDSAVSSTTHDLCRPHRKRAEFQDETHATNPLLHESQPRESPPYYHSKTARAWLLDALHSPPAVSLRES